MHTFHMIFKCQLCVSHGLSLAFYIKLDSVALTAEEVGHMFSVHVTMQWFHKKCNCIFTSTRVYFQLYHTAWEVKRSHHREYKSHVHHGGTCDPSCLIWYN